MDSSDTCKLMLAQQAGCAPPAATPMFATFGPPMSQAHSVQKAFALEKRPFLLFFYGLTTCSTYAACGTPRCGWNHLRRFPLPRACLGSSAEPDEEQQLTDLAGAAELRPRAVPCEQLERGASQGPDV